MVCLINMVAPLDLCGAKEGKSSRRHPLDRLSFLSCSSDVESLRSFRFLCLLLALPALLVSSLLTDDVDERFVRILDAELLDHLPRDRVGLVG